MCFRYPFLPCLHVGDVKKNIYLPMEVCRLVKGQQCKKKLNEELTARMIKQTAKRPHERQKTIMTKVSALKERLLNSGFLHKSYLYLIFFALVITN